MNKAELIAEVSIRTGLSKLEVGRVVTACFETVEDAVCRNEKVHIKGFGTFEAQVKKARKARNPITKEEIELSETVAPVFKAGDKFKKAVSENNKER